jgi:hypothetical protein
VFEVRTEGVESTIIAIRAQRGEAGRELRRLVENTAEFGANVMTRLAPHREGHLRGRISATRAHFRPGGPGGGGVYEAEFGVGDEPGPERDLPFWVYHGTGIFADELGLEVSGISADSLLHQIPDAARDHVIRPDDPSKRMTFQGNFGTVSVPYVLGQRPQKEWVDEAYDAASEYMDLHTNGMFS